MDYCHCLPLVPFTMLACLLLANRKHPVNTNSFLELFLVPRGKDNDGVPSQTRLLRRQKTWRVCSQSAMGVCILLQGLTSGNLSMVILPAVDSHIVGAENAVLWASRLIATAKTYWALTRAKLGSKHFMCINSPALWGGHCSHLHFINEKMGIERFSHLPMITKQHCSGILDSTVYLDFMHVTTTLCRNKWNQIGMNVKL